MAISTTTYILIGSGTASEAVTLVSVANNASASGAVVDMLGDDASVGVAELYLILTSTVTAGTLDLRFNPQRRLNSGTAEYAKVSYELSVVPTNGTQRLPLGRRECSRYMNVDYKNNATGASLTFAILAKVVKQV